GLLLSGVGCGSSAPAAPPPPAVAAAVTTSPTAPLAPPPQVADPALPFAFQFTPTVYAGAAPVGDAGFAALKRLGIQTIISVDGMTPEVARAEKFGLRYIHLPIRYSGVPVEREQEIAKAILFLPGKTYIHCHHGKFRGASACAASCVVAGLISNEQALMDMQTMQTAQSYVGLWASARTAQPVPRAQLEALQVAYKSVQPIPPLASTMVLIDHHHDALIECQQAGWRIPTKNPDFDPPHEALQVREFFRELQRTVDFAGRPANFQQWTRDEETAAANLETKLDAWQAAKALASAKPPAEIDAAFADMDRTCVACHKIYRNVPQKLAAR
ncbi:MAG: hypothetical protein ACREJ2_08585, partial [Planctomycetota bacterium]